MTKVCFQLIGGRNEGVWGYLGRQHVKQGQICVGDVIMSCYLASIAQSPPIDVTTQ